MYRYIFDLFTRSNGGIVALILGGIAFVGFHLLFPDYSKIECTSAEKPCVLTSNFFGFKSSKRTLAPVSVNKTSVERTTYYFSRHNRRYRYNVYLLGKYGNKDLIFRDILLQSTADAFAADILYCITARKYPCSVSKSVFNK